jgi:hypothetical protein
LLELSHLAIDISPISFATGADRCGRAVNPEVAAAAKASTDQLGSSASASAYFQDSLVCADLELIHRPANPGGDDLGLPHGFSSLPSLARTVSGSGKDGRHDN